MVVTLCDIDVLLVLLITGGNVHPSQLNVHPIQLWKPSSRTPPSYWWWHAILPSRDIEIYIFLFFPRYDAQGIQ
jgi:hypothetical protein